ncbi:spore germination protein [Caldalkalibacillus thermarum TA2.A1]|uniref:Spore germination protein n=1 Tax=Caldalkalibacillus thermarum (strain TA2.A1) TaxID=986075 RepID=F5L8B4_CALTT|nr:endospore germination permease [Caldalkalibacillus thermarum]EGL82434.1 spore germination protein [Caldalkalibacillus thermarum TA2.A1]QZT35350.1 spore germination protein [Caldalkalibacillus thermarum TA2.A1]
MIEKGRIAAYEMAVMMYPAIIATAILLVPAITAADAGRDAWLSPVWGSLVGFLTVYIAYKLNQNYPQETIIQYSVSILGLLPGKVVGLIYLFFYLHSNGIILREYAEFVDGVFLPRTPMALVLGIMTFVCALAVRGGLEVMARTALVFVPPVIFLLVFGISLLFGDMDPGRLLPVLENGIGPTLMGAKAPQAWFSEFLLVTFMLPFVTDRENGLKWGMLTVLAVMLTLVLTNLFILMVFGELTENLLYPVMDAARYISIADFFENLQPVVMAIWVAGMYVKITVFYYALALGTAQWLHLSNHKPTVFPLGLLLVVFALWSGHNLTELKDFLATIVPFYLTSVQTLLPLLLLLLVVTLKRNQTQGGWQR